MTVSKSLNHVIVTPMRTRFVDNKNFTPMRALYDDKGNVKLHKVYGFVMTKPMTAGDFLETEVTK